MAIGIKKWNGSAWVNSAVKRWNGSAWVDAYTYRWNGSKWIQIYPETIVTQSFGWQTGGNFRSWRQAGYETTTSTTTCKQGPYGSYTPAYGYTDVTSASIPGSGSISSISQLLLTATRGGSGSYNADKTIFFYRSANAPTAVPTLLGSAFTATAPGVGSGTVFYNQPVSITADTLNWTNQVGGGKYLWIYTSDANHYLSLGPSFKLDLTYSYAAVSALFVDDGQAVAYMRESDYKEENGSEKIYHKMPIYKDEVGLTLYEIMERRESGIVQDIDPTTVNYEAIVLPWFREREIFTDENNVLKFKIEAMNMNMENEAQYSLDNTEWQTLYGTNEGDYVQTDLPSDFNKYSDNIYVRIIDKEKEMIIVEDIIKPLIYIP
jgi:hypothetical protein